LRAMFQMLWADELLETSVRCKRIWPAQPPSSRGGGRKCLRGERAMRGSPVATLDI
jgi:hypothetical protein